jgi:hypothetical protein|nr:hypothetical protein [Kofleriaceae bacterium]
MSDSNGNFFLKGAFVQLSPQLVSVTPNIVVFQYNPESLQRKRTTWNPPQSLESEAKKDGSPTATQPFDPTETITLALELDATDDLGDPDLHPLAVSSGVAARIAAIEELLYAVPADTLSGDTLTSLGDTSSAASQPDEVPIVLFVWGPGRCLPVRFTDFSVEEQLFSPELYPLRAKVSMSMQVYGPPWFAQRKASRKSQQLSAAESMAQAAYKYTRSQSGKLARANTGNNADAILSLLPF